MAAPVTLRNAADASARQKFPTSNMSTGDRMAIGNFTNEKEETYLYFTLPFTRGVTVVDATLWLRQYYAWSGSITISVQRVSTSWSASKLTWNTKPASTGTIVTTTKSGPAAGTFWSFDLTPIFQEVSDGAAWYGLRIWVSAGGTTVHNFWISPTYGIADYRPTLEVEWADNPREPLSLYPSNGRAVSIAKPTLRFDFLDVSGDTSLQAVQVQINPTNSFTASAFDSGVVSAEVPELNLNNTAYAGIAVDATAWWRARVQDGAGLWSDWSAPTSFIRKSRGTLTMTNPSGTTISDATPPLTWTFTGRTQTAYQIFVQDVASNNLLWTSGKITSSVKEFTIPSGVLRYNNKQYKITISVWDEIAREATPGDPIPTSVSKTVTYQYSAVTAPATDLTASSGGVFPWVTLEWQRSALPDTWNIYRDGKLLKATDGNDLFVSGTTYRYVDRLPLPYTTSTYQVVAVVNGVGSSSSPTVTVTNRALSLCLSNEDGSNACIILNYDAQMDLQYENGVFAPAGGGPPVVLTQAERGYQGTIQGVLDRIGVGGSYSAQYFRNAYLKLIDNPGATRLLTVLDESFECFVYNATIKPLHDGASVVYAVKFDFAQTDYIP